MLSQSVPRALLSPHLCLEGVMHTSGAAASPGAPLASWQLLLRCPELNKLSQVCTNTTWKLSAEWQFLLTLLQGSPYLLEQLLDFFFFLNQQVCISEMLWDSDGSMAHEHILAPNITQQWFFFLPCAGGQGGPEPELQNFFLPPPGWWGPGHFLHFLQNEEYKRQSRCRLKHIS